MRWFVIVLMFFNLSCSEKNPVGNTDDDSDGLDTHEILGIIFISIPGGSFRMGDISGGGFSDERPEHTVTVTGFEMSTYEITQGQYESIIGVNPCRLSAVAIACLCST